MGERGKRVYLRNSVLRGRSRGNGDDEAVSAVDGEGTEDGRRAM